MNKNTRLWIAAAAVAVVVTSAAGVAAGRYNNRWGLSQELENASGRITQVPDTFGNWQAISSQSLEPDVEKMLECAGSVVRVYQNRETGQTVSMALIVGPTGPISVHTPEICYSSRDYKLTKDRDRAVVRSSENARDSFWTVSFQKADAADQSLHVSYAWNSGSEWVAPDWPRFAFAGKRYLYKLQLATAKATSATGDKATEPFLKELLPILDATLFTGSKS